MAIQFMDNFQSYGTSLSYMLDGLPYAQVSSSALVADPDGVSSGRVLVYAVMRVALPNVTSKVGAAFRCWMSQLPAGPTNRFSVALFTDPGNSVIRANFIVEPNGAMTIQDAAGTIVATTTNPVVAPQSWFHYECMVDTSTGDYELRIEGITILTGTSALLVASTIGNIRFFGSGVGGPTPYLKDLIIWDGTGTVNNNFMGTVSVYTLALNSDVSSDWTPSTGTSDYQLLDETTPNDADYISAGIAVPYSSVMGMSDLASDVVAVRGLQTMVRASKSDGGDATLVVGVKSATNTDTGANHAVTTAKKYWFDISELDPDTGALWDPLAVNAANLVIDRTV